MASYNKITLVGNVGADPQLTMFEATKVASFSVAVNESYMDKNGQKVERTEWFRVGVWGNRADVIMNYVKRGSQIMVEGRLNTRTWTEQSTGKERFGLEVRASDFVLLGGPAQQGGQQLPPPGAQTYSTPRASSPAMANEPAMGMNAGMDDDLPF